MQNLADIVYLVGDEDDKWPMIKDTSNFFIQKFNQMNYLTVGMDRFPYPDYLINSKIVSNWHCISLSNSENERQNNERFRTIINLCNNYEEYSGNDDKIKFGTEQFIDYDCTHLYEFDASNNRQKFHELINTLSSLEVVRIDSSGNERWVINEIFEAGFLPSLMYVRFGETPEKNVLNRNLIGHLRMIGYSILYIYEDKYLFYFTDKSVYNLFNVNELGFKNPFITNIIGVVTDEFKKWNENKTEGFSVKLTNFYK